MVSCEKQQLSTESESVATKEIFATSGNDENPNKEIVLGKKLKIPYALDVVENAQKSLKSKSPNFKTFKVKENYLYVRFTPKSIAEYDLVNQDSTLNTFNRPLDYEIAKNGSSYKDPNVIDYGFGSIYCVIPADKQYNELKYDVLEKLYIPFGSGGKDKESKRLEKLQDEQLTALDNEILETTGYKVKSSKGKIGDWNPYGYIRVASTYGSSSYVPVQGCKVRSTKALVVTYSAITNTDGFYYITNSYWNISEVNYDIKWERDDYDLRFNAWDQAYTPGPKLGTGWNLNINPATPAGYVSYMFAWVNNAANYYYYYSSLMGIQSPPTCTPRTAYGLAAYMLSQRMKIKVTDGWSAGGASHYLDFNANWLAAQISVLFNSTQSSDIIFAVACHELGHASHWSLGYTTADYVAGLNNNRRYAESWAQCIGWFMTAKYFSPNRFINYNNYIFPHNLTYDVGIESQQYFTLSDQKLGLYTSAFIDLVDDYSQYDCPESASGYTMNQIESAISKCPTNWDNIKNKLASEYPNNPSKTQMTWIFNNYK